MAIADGTVEGFITERLDGLIKRAKKSKKGKDGISDIALMRITTEASQKAGKELAKEDISELLHRRWQALS